MDRIMCMFCSDMVKLFYNLSRLHDYTQVSYCRCPVKITPCFFQSLWIKSFVSLPRGEPPHSHIHEKVLSPRKKVPALYKRLG